MGAILEERRQGVEDRIKALGTDLADTERAFAGRACVYLTGSFGRGEASVHSDLDLFILGAWDETREKRQLARLDEICLKADLIRAAKKLDFPDFDRDGEFLQHHTAHDLVERLGQATDDAENTLTARLLLLLESRPLFGKDLYEDAVSEVIAVYWREFDRHRDDFEPSFLANDILRLWRTFCLNYEAIPQRKIRVDRAAKRRLKNYKLKHSRLLTCYSAIAFLLAEFTRQGTVTPDAARDMVRRTPTQRIEALAADQRTLAAAKAVLAEYEDFLATTDASEDELLQRLEASPAQFARPPGALGDRMFELLEFLGGGSGFYRRLVV